MKMSQEQATKAQYGLIELFEDEFKLGQASVTNTGAIKFSTERAFGIYYTLYNILRANYPDLADLVTSYLRSNYKNKTWDDIQKEERKSRAGDMGDELLRLIDKANLEFED